ncbi:MAG: hypothetical protein KTR17_00775 [Cellvibrionaceae bacterium]|nr:hypothetical protein [Cellvibrionaceae bacterium]
MLPITRVVIYKHGLAFYQREGLISGSSVIELSFKAEQMNDVLKSLTTLDYGEGHFSALSYDSEEPAEKRLADLSIQLPKGAAITQFLDQLKGVHVAVNTPTMTIEGAIIGVEELAFYAKSAENSRSTLPHLALLNPDTGMNYVLLQNIQNIQFTDENIQQELSTLMDIHAGIARNEKKRLSIQAIGEGERKISVSYVVEAPVWKTSYRMIMLDDDTNQHLLQGWSIVDNTCDEDWQNVKLTLVSGLPISFRHNLYSPRFLARPEIKVDQTAAVAPPVLESPVAAGIDLPVNDDIDFLEEAPGLRMAKMDALLASPTPRAQRFASSVKKSNPIQTRTEEKGDLFSYEVNTPVSIKRGQSALVPILQTRIDSEKIVYYNESIRRENPMSSFRIKNSTPLTLEGGPITVYQGDNYLGEAMLDTLRKQEEKIVPYSVDLAITVSTKGSTRDQDYTKATKSGHYIHKYRKRETITEYLFDSKSEQAATLYLDHAFKFEMPEQNNTGTAREELVEVTENYWRYRIPLPAKSQTSYQVVELQYVSEAITIPNISTYEITSLTANNLINPATAQQLEHIAKLCQQRSKLEKELESNSKRYAEISDGQDRLRNNIHALGTSVEESKLRARYIAKLEAEEDALEHTLAVLESLKKDISSMALKIEEATDAMVFNDD